MNDSRASSNRLGQVLDRIERLGNRLPDPLTLFVVLAALVPLVSWVISLTGWTMINPTTQQPITVVNLLAPAQLQRVFSEAVANFTAFPPLGTVLVAVIGIGVAERSGLIATLLKLLVTAVPPTLITATIVFAGVMSSLAADAGYVVLIPLGAVLFAGVGRNPIAGLCAAFAGVAGGFSANLLLTSLDPLLAGLTQAAAQLYDPQYLVAPTANYYFMAASVFVLTPVGWWISEKIVEPRLGPWQAPEGLETRLTETTVREKQAAGWAGVIFVLTLGVFAGISFLPGALLNGENGNLQPFYRSLVLLLSVAFFLPGLAYGLLTGSIRSDRDVAQMAGDTMATMGSYIVLAFAAAQFVAYFSWSNLGLMLALAGAETLRAVGLGGLPLILGIVVISAVIDLLIGSASAKWAVMATVFVPLGMNLGYSPELIQAAYRVGDSVVNMITPLNPYFPIVIAFAQKYDPKIRIGTLISAMLPFSSAFLISWTLMLLVWFVGGLPLGPDAPLYYGAG